MKIIISNKAFQKMRGYVEGVKKEISGLGKISYDEKNQEFTVHDVKIFKQKVTGVDTVLDQGALGKFYDEIMKTEGDLTNWKLWWHSHADMDTFFSGTDKSTIEDFDNETKEDNWFLSIVTNRAGDMEARVDLFYPLRVTVDNIYCEPESISEEVKKEVKKDIEENVDENEGIWDSMKGWFAGDEEEPVAKKLERKNKKTLPKKYNYA